MKDDAGLRDMVLAALEDAGGEDYLRKHGGDHLIAAYRRVRSRAPGVGQRLEAALLMVVLSA
jgi:hypothetical protein